MATLTVTMASREVIYYMKVIKVRVSCLTPLVCLYDSNVLLDPSGPAHLRKIVCHVSWPLLFGVNLLKYAKLNVT